MFYALNVVIVNVNHIATCFLTKWTDNKKKGLEKFAQFKKKQYFCSRNNGGYKKKSV